MKPLDRDSRRLIDEVSAGDLPPAGADARIWETLAQRLGEPLPPTAAAASQALAGPSAGGLLAGVGAKWLITALVCGALGSGTALWYAARPAASASGVPVLIAQPQAATLADVQQPPAAEIAPPAASAAPPVAAGAPPVASSNLSEETRLIAEAQRALNGGAAGKALDLIEQHSLRFPNGALAQERDAARVLALCALGRAGDAQRERQAFTRRWPDSPLAPRLRAACSSHRARSAPATPP